MFDPNMNQPYSFAGLVKIMLSFALLLLKKNDGQSNTINPQSLRGADPYGTYGPEAKI